MDECGFLWIIGCAVGAEDIMEPDPGFGAVGHGGIPGILCIGLSLTRPQLIATTFSFFSNGMTLKKVLPLRRAIYSVQMSGRPYFLRVSIQCLCFSGPS